MTNEKVYESIKSRFIVIPFVAIPQRAVPVWAHGSINVHEHVTHDIMSYERGGDFRGCMLIYELSAPQG